MTEKEKLVVCKLLYEHKAVLFGDLDNSKGITNDAKRKLWQKIFNQLKTEGNSLAKRDFAFLRDNDWKNWKNAVKVSKLSKIFLPGL